MLERLSDEDIMQEYVLSKIIRYNHRRRLQDESVAEHSFYVGLFCLKIMKKLQLSDEIEKNVLILALLHDTAESVTSDLPHDVKENFPEMRRILDKIEDEYLEANWTEYECAIRPLNPNIVYETSVVLTRAIVKLADCYSVYQYCLNEKSLGNCSDELDMIYNSSLHLIEEWERKVNELYDCYNEVYNHRSKMPFEEE